MNTEAERLAALLEARSRAVINGIEAIDPDFVLHLASSTLKQVLHHFIDGDGGRDRVVFAMPREEEGVVVAAGLEIADRRPVLIFQDNGIGNLLTALLTVPQAYHVPLFGIVSRRGGLGRVQLDDSHRERTQRGNVGRGECALVPAGRAHAHRVVGLRDPSGLDLLAHHAPTGAGPGQSDGRLIDVSDETGLGPRRH